MNICDVGRFIYHSTREQDYFVMPGLYSML